MLNGLTKTASTVSAFPAVIIIFIFGLQTANGQGLVRHQSPQFAERNIPFLLEFEFPELSDDDVLEALLFTKTDNQSGFNQRETRVTNRRAEFRLLIESENVTSLEYYFVIRTRSGRQITFPDIVAGEPPLRLEVIDQRAGSYIPAGFIDVTVLSPEAGRVIDQNDFIFAAALFYDDEDVEGGRFSLHLNGNDISNKAEISPFLIKFIPDSIGSGEQHLRIVFEKDNKRYSAAEYSFRIAGNLAPVVSAEAGGQVVRTADILPRGTLEFSTKNQQIAGQTNDALDGRLQFSGQQGLLNYSFSGFLTSRESSRLQPQNRFSGELNVGKWVNVKAGDVFPVFTNLSINGRRIRGFYSEVNLLNEHLGIQFLYGDMQRSISNIYTPIEVTEQMVGEQVVDTTFSIGFADGGRGSFEQEAFGARLSVGREDKVQFSVHGLKVEDDIESTGVIRNFNDVPQFGDEIQQNLSDEDIENLGNNPEDLQINGVNPRPRGNFVAGTELRMAFDSQRIQFRTEMAASLLNNDITGGPLDQERADELGIELDEDTESLFRRLSTFIVINDNMDTLPFRFTQNEDGKLEVDAFFPTSILANQSILDLRYLGHNLQVQYRWIGPDYQSIANNTFQRDVAGFTVTDRFRLFDNQLFLTLGYENLRDNLAKNLNATLRTKTARSSLSWFPVNQALPGITVSVRHRTRDNDIERFNPFVESQFLNEAVRNFEIAGGDTVAAPNPRDNRTLSINSTVSKDFNLLNSSHRVNFTYSYLDTKDNAFTFGNTESNTFSFLLTTRFDSKPYRTRIGWNASFTESSGGLTDIDIYAIDLGGDLFLLDNKMSINADVSFARNTFTSTQLVVDDNNTPDNFFDNRFVAADDQDPARRSTNAYIFRIGTGYDITPSHSIIASANYTSVDNRLSTPENFSDDRILQLRYIFRF